MSSVPDSVRFIYARQAPSPLNWYTQDDFRGCLITWEPPADEPVVGYVIFRTAERLDDDCAYDLLEGFLEDVADRLDVPRAVRAVVDDQVHDRNRYLVLARTASGDYLTVDDGRAEKLTPSEHDALDPDEFAWWSNPVGPQRNREPRRLDYLAVRPETQSAFEWHYPEDVAQLARYEFIISRQPISPHTGDEHDIAEFRAVLRGEHGARIELEPWVDAVIDNVTEPGSYAYFALLACDELGCRTQIPLRHVDALRRGQPHRLLRPGPGGAGVGLDRMQLAYESWLRRHSAPAEEPEEEVAPPIEPPARGDTSRAPGLANPAAAPADAPPPYRPAAAAASEPPPSPVSAAPPYSAPAYAPPVGSSALPLRDAPPADDDDDELPPPPRARASLGDDLPPPPRGRAALGDDDLDGLGRRERLPIGEREPLQRLDDAVVSEAAGSSSASLPLREPEPMPDEPEPAAARFAGALAESRLDPATWASDEGVCGLRLTWVGTREGEPLVALRATAPLDDETLVEAVLRGEQEPPAGCDRVRFAAPSRGSLVDLDCHDRSWYLVASLADGAPRPVEALAARPLFRVPDVSSVAYWHCPDERLRDRLLHVPRAERVVREEAPVGLELGPPDDVVDPVALELYRLDPLLDWQEPTAFDVRAFHELQRGESQRAGAVLRLPPGTRQLRDDLSPPGRWFVAAALVDHRNNRHPVLVSRASAEASAAWPLLSTLCDGAAPEPAGLPDDEPPLLSVLDDEPPHVHTSDEVDAPRAHHDDEGDDIAIAFTEDEEEAPAALDAPLTLTTAEHAALDPSPLPEPIYADGFVERLPSNPAMPLLDVAAASRNLSVPVDATPSEPLSGLTSSVAPVLADLVAEAFPREQPLAAAGATTADDEDDVLPMPAFTDEEEEDDDAPLDDGVDGTPADALLVASVAAAERVAAQAAATERVAAEAAPAPALRWQRVFQAPWFNRLHIEAPPGSRIRLLWSDAAQPPEVSDARSVEALDGVRLFELSSAIVLDNLTERSAHVLALFESDARWEVAGIRVAEPPWSSEQAYAPVLDPAGAARVDGEVARRVAAARRLLREQPGGEAARAELVRAHLVGRSRARVLAFARAHGLDDVAHDLEG